MKPSILLSICLIATSLFADEKPMPKHEGSEELQKVKALAGTWFGEMDHGKGPMPCQITYRVTAGGSAVVETFNPGTPMEMVSMYHDEKGKLTMTHYCMLGNQPKMRLSKAKGKQVVLKLLKKAVPDLDKPHMNGLTIDFLAKDKIKHTWGCCEGGDKCSNMTVEFTRKK